MGLMCVGEPSLQPLAAFTALQCTSAVLVHMLHAVSKGQGILGYEAG
jgi:hypothetical protein